MVANRVNPETGKAAKLGNSKLRLSRWAEGYEREQGRIRCEERVRNNERRRGDREVVRTPWERPRHWARVRRERMVPGRARGPVDEGWVDMEAWRRAEAEAWEKVEDRRMLEFSRLERGAVRGREDLVEGWREDLDRYNKGERAALGKAHADSARQIERKVREMYRTGLQDAEQHARITVQDLVQRAAREGVRPASGDRTDAMDPGIRSSSRKPSSRSPGRGRLPDHPRVGRVRTAARGLAILAVSGVSRYPC